MIVLAVVSVLASSEVALSEPSSAPAVVTAAPSAAVREWSLGAGLGYCVYDWMPLGSFGGLGISIAPALQVHMLAERHLTRGLWLMLAANASYAGGEHENASFNGGSAMRNAYKQQMYGGTVGLRYQFDLGGIVELSPYLMVGGAYVKSETGYGDIVQTYDGGVLRARLGVMAERELVRGFSIRLGTSLVEARYVDLRGVSQQPNAEPQMIAARTGSIGLSIEPSIELRMRF